MLAGELLDARHAGSAIEFDDEHWSHAELSGLANRFAHWFRTAGLVHGDRVSLLFGNDPLMVGAYFGAFRSGLVANPINTRLTPPEVAYVLNHAGSRCVVVSAEFAPLLQETLPLLDQRPIVLCLRQADEPGIGAALLACPIDDLAPTSLHPDDGALLIYTSGTTGNPKGVLLTHRNIVAAIRIIARAFELGPGERTMCVMPLFHTNALMFSHLAFLFAGATVVLRPRFSATRFWDDCLRFQVTAGSVSPTMLAMLLAHADGAPAAGETGLKYMKVASAPTPIELAERFEARFGKGLLLESYGLTETTAISTMNPLHGRRKFGSIGQVVAPQELALVDDAGVQVGPGRIGEIALRGETVMREYFRDPDNTARVLVDGWFRSGDLARQDDDGFVFIVGRQKDMILRGGENISPLEIEQIVARHPAVREAAVVGLADAMWGEVVGLAVVRAALVEADALRAFCAGHLSPFKIPERVAFVDALPRNAMGKVVRGALRASFAAGND